MNENTLLFFVNKSNSSGQKQLSIMDSMHYPQLPPDFLLLAQQLLALLLRTHLGAPFNGASFILSALSQNFFLFL